MRGERRDQFKFGRPGRKERGAKLEDYTYTGCDNKGKRVEGRRCDDEEEGGGWGQKDHQNQSIESRQRCVQGNDLCVTVRQGEKGGREERKGCQQ